MFTTLIISLCLLSYPNTNYSFLSLCDRKVGDAFLSRLTPSIIHTQHPHVCLCSVVCLWISPKYTFFVHSGTYLQIILWWSITGLEIKGCTKSTLQLQYILCELSFLTIMQQRYNYKINKPTKKRHTIRLEPYSFFCCFNLSAALCNSAGKEAVKL